MGLRASERVKIVEDKMRGQSAEKIPGKTEPSHVQTKIDKVRKEEVKRGGTMQYK